MKAPFKLASISINRTLNQSINVARSNWSVFSLRFINLIAQSFPQICLDDVRTDAAEARLRGCTLSDFMSPSPLPTPSHSLAQPYLQAHQLQSHRLRNSHSINRHHTRPRQDLVESKHSLRRIEDPASNSQEPWPSSSLAV